MSAGIAYIAGPMRGLPEFNFPAFHHAEEVLREDGWMTFNPARSDEEAGFDPTKDEALPLKHYMKKDLPEVCVSDAVFVLSGWENSDGATLEVDVARRCGIPVYDFDEFCGGGGLLIEAQDASDIRHPNSARFHEIMGELKELHDRKQRDYGRGDDPFANVRSTEEWGVPAWVGALIRLNDKVHRLKSLRQNGQLANESAEDSMRDIAVYAVIALVLFEQREPTPS